MTDELRGLTMYVYRGAGGTDFTLKGASSKVDRFTVVGSVDRHGNFYLAHEQARVFAPTEEAPAAVLVEHRNGESAHVRTLEDWQAGHWTMAGGNFAHTSDSRFTAYFFERFRVQPFYGAVSIHDRMESGR